MLVFDAKIIGVFDPSKPPLSLAELAQRSFAKFADKPYLGWKVEKTYQFSTYREIAERVKNLSGTFLKLGLERGERVAIIGETSVEWALCDLACQMCGLIVVPLFSTLPPNQIQTILCDAAPRAVLVADAKQQAKVEQIRAEVPSLEHVWLYGDVAALEAQGASHLQQHPALYEQTWPAALPNDVATLIYTSGTTGEPKGVMLAHKNIIADVEGVCKIAPHLGQDDLFLSFLPLAHVYERTAGHYFPLRLGATVAYSESLFTVDKNMAEVRPTVMTCVPRLYESSREKLFSAAKSLPEKRRQTYLAALELAKKAGMHAGRFPGAPSLSLLERLKYFFYDRAVYSKIRDRFGGRLKHFVSGGAPMSPDLGALFIGLGLETLEGYGLTETAPVIAVNMPGRPRLGTVGPPLPGVEVKIESDGEIVVRGATVMKGYWNKPDATREVLTPDGWFHTGDIGELSDGLLKITDRKKDLLVLANGKKVAPQPIELRLQESRYISQAVLLGDKMKAVTALVVPNFPTLREWASKNGIAVRDEAELVKNAEVVKLFRQEIDAQTDNLADFEKIRKIVLLEEAFSPQNGELTPTLKVKRNVVAKRYGALAE